MWGEIVLTELSPGLIRRRLTSLFPAALIADIACERDVVQCNRTIDITMLKGPIPATEQALEQAEMEIEDNDLFEINEAFASVVAAWLTATGPSWEDTNVNGGAIAHGHPLGATGSMLLTKLAHNLERTGQDYGLVTMCIGFGQGIATTIERV